MKRRDAFPLLVVAVSLAVAAPCFHAEEATNILRFGPGYMQVDSGKSEVGNQRAAFDDTASAQFGYERKLTELIGLDFGLRVAAPKVKFEGRDRSEEVAFATLSFGTMFHVFRNQRIDLFLGPQLGLSSLEDVKTPQGKANSKSNLALGLRLGADLLLGHGWAINVGIEYQEAKLRINDEGSFKGEGDFKLNPLSAFAGASVRF